MDGEPLCPDPEAWRLSWIVPRRDRIVIHLEPVREGVPCPSCREKSRRVHSRYRRTPWDLPWSGWSVQLVVHARRFFCDQASCSRRIFTERFPDVLAPYARQTERLRRRLLELAHASGAETAARLSKLLGFPTSADTLIRRQREEQFTISPPRVLGVDEFGLRLGFTYATLLVDLERRRLVDVVKDRKAAPLARWLEAHPDVEVLARDRAGAYALASRRAAPHALQVADRFHLVRNVTDALKELLRSRRWSRPGSQIDTVALPTGEPPPAPRIPLGHPGEPQPTPTKRARWEAVQERRNNGQSLSAIARELGMNRGTVRKYLVADRPPVYGPRRPRPTRLTPYLSYLRERWLQGCHNGRRLYRELLQRGYTGSESQLRGVLRPWRSAQAPPPPRRAPPLHWLLLRPHRRLTPSQKQDLERILEANPVLALAHRLKEGFQRIVADRNADALDAWLHEAAECGLAPFQTLARSLRQDYEAIKLALTTPWSTAQCEGHICRVKLIKRLGYGRAKLDLLRQRILHRAISR